MLFSDQNSEHNPDSGSGCLLRDIFLISEIFGNFPVLFAKSYQINNLHWWAVRCLQILVKMQRCLSVKRKRTCELKDSTQRSEHKIDTKRKVGELYHLYAIKLDFFSSFSNPDIFSIFARSLQTISDPSTHNSAVTNYSHKKFFLIFLFPRLIKKY